MSGCDNYDTELMRQHQMAADVLNPLAQAIERYQSEHEEYPETLEDVIPNYLEKLPVMPAGVGDVWYKRRDYYYLSNYYTDLTSREYFLVVDIDSGTSIQRDEVLSYYPTRWRTSDHLDYEPTPRTSVYNRPIALDDEWVRYRD